MTIRRASLAVAMASILLLAVATKALAVNISGTVRNTSGTALCGLVLANGQFVFSCAPTGEYSLEVPLDAAGQITLFAFVDGHFPYKVVLTSGGRHDPSLSPGTPPPANNNRARSEMLVGGTWTFVYTIISTFRDSYTFTSVSNTPDRDGDFFVTGTSTTGRPVGGMYVSSTGLWAVLHPGILIDQFYTFSFSGNNNVSGCYYQINPPGSTNVGRCYSMSGTRSPPKGVEENSDPEKLIQEAAMLATPGFAEPSAEEAYSALSRYIRR